MTPPCAPKLPPIDSLRDLIYANDRRYEQRFLDSKTAVDAALSAAKEAVIKAEVAADKRFESVNEFRGTLADQQVRLIPRAEVLVLIQGMQEKVDNLKIEMARLQQERLGVISWVGSAAGVIGFLFLVFSLIGLFLKFKS
jgi:hypothetical protein